MLWRAKTENLVEDLEASKLAIHNLMQENLSLQVTIQQNQEESQRIQEEAKVKLEAKIHQDVRFSRECSAVEDIKKARKVAAMARSFCETMEM